jgi:hypothetical protein
MNFADHDPRSPVVPKKHYRLVVRKTTRSWLRAISRSARFPLIVTSFGALVAAILKQIISLLFKQGWSWPDFAKDVVQNGFIAVLVSFLLASIALYQNRLRLQLTQSSYVLKRIEIIALAINGWNTIPVAEEAENRSSKTELAEADLTELRAQAKQWRMLAKKIERIRDAEIFDFSESEPDEMDAFVKKVENTLNITSDLGVLHFELEGFYLLEGARTRRIIWLNMLISDLASIELAEDPSLSAAAHTCRKSATELVGWVQHTDSTISERLIVQRDFPNWGSADASNRLFGLYNDKLTPAAAAVDPCYVLLSYIYNVQKAIRSGRSVLDIDWNDIRELFNEIRRPLGALRNELRAAADTAEDLLLLVEEARRVNRSL